MPSTVQPHNFSPSLDPCSSCDGNQGRERFREKVQLHLEVSFASLKPSSSLLHNLHFHLRSFSAPPLPLRLATLWPSLYSSLSPKLELGGCSVLGSVAIRGLDRHCKKPRLGKGTGSCTSVHLSICFLHVLGTSSLPSPS